jgi:ankyrin repeat protein
MISEDKCELFIDECKEGNLDAVKKMLKDPEIDPAYDDNYAIQKAVYNGHISIVKELLKDSRVDPSDDNNFALCWSAESKKAAKTIEFILKDKRVDPTENNDEPLINACRAENYNVVKVLLEDGRVNLDARNNDAIHYILINAESFLPIFLNNKKYINKLYDICYKMYINSSYDNIPFYLFTILKSMFNVKTVEELQTILTII